MRWAETGGPPVARPTHEGFGTRLLAAGLPGLPAGAVTLDFAPGGLRCAIHVVGTEPGQIPAPSSDAA